MTSKNKLYKVTVKCGHVKKNYYIPITFAIKAEDGKEAAAIARWIPRVKHHNKNAVLECVEIDYDEFQEINTKNRSNPYLKCSSKQEQRYLIPNIDELVVNEDEQKRNMKQKTDRIQYVLKKQKIELLWTEKLMQLGREEYSYQLT
ncbi:hypothetical protein JN09_000697 [Acholeplasma morum]|uniref:hypothetical protein n=1 Tax=Paracholeplasma morum TaxID=264637 RepID=UPI001956410C|nr:hypothetical protein [Paracholeplasma morum]MBM7453371.1 hypothetical protein [Paracholeplasma morum]